MKLSPLQAIIEYADWSQIRWGLKPCPGFLDRKPVLSAGLPFSVENFQYVRGAPDAQTVGSCAHNTTTGIAEWFFCKARNGAESIRLNYDYAYWWYRKNVLHDMSDNGSSMDGAADAAIAMGMFPAGTTWTRVSLSPQALCLALSEAPLFVGQCLHPGWSPSALQAGTGAVDESRLRDLDPLAGHAMMVCDSNIRPNGVWMIGNRQSWGPVGNKGDGIVWQSGAHYLKTALDEAILFRVSLEAMRNYEFRKELVL
jgi:hypothetical protein